MCCAVFKSTCVIGKSLSDFHFMTLTIMRKEYWKFQSRLISYRSYRQFSNEKFRENLLLNLSKESLVNDADGFQKFCDIGLETLDKLALCKQKYVRSSQMPFLTKELSKEIVTRFRLQSYLKHRNDTNRLLYTKQRNSCVSLLRKTKKRYYDNLNKRCVIDNKLFWKAVKPFLSDKVMTIDTIYLTKKDKIIKTDKKQWPI